MINKQKSVVCRLATGLPCLYDDQQVKHSCAACVRRNETKQDVF